MAMEGMNVDAVRQISRDLKAQAGLLNSVSGRIDGFINRTQNQWRGTDATDFQSWWRNQHRARVVQLVQDLEGLAQSLSNNADEQDRASGGSSSPGSAGVVPSSGDKSQTQDNGNPGSTNPAPTTTPSSPQQSADSGKINETDFKGDFKTFHEQWQQKYVTKYTDDQGNVHQVGVDQWGYFKPLDGKGDCTSFVAWRLNQLAAEKGTGWSFTNSSVPGHPGLVLGDASQWGTELPHDSNPTPGSVAWFSYGHVAVVRSVGSDGSVVLEQSSFEGGESTYTVKPGGTGYPTGFLHMVPGT